MGEEKKLWKNQFYGTRERKASIEPDPRQMDLFAPRIPASAIDAAGASVLETRSDEPVVPEFFYVPQPAALPEPAPAAALEAIEGAPCKIAADVFEAPSEDAVLGDEIIAPLEQGLSPNTPQAPETVSQRLEQPELDPQPLVPVSVTPEVAQPTPEQVDEAPGSLLAPMPPPAEALALIETPSRVEATAPAIASPRPPLPDSHRERLEYLVTAWLHRMRDGSEERGGVLMSAVNGVGMHAFQSCLASMSGESKSWGLAPREQLVELTSQCARAIMADRENLRAYHFGLYESIARLLIALGASTEEAMKAELQALRKLIKAGSKTGDEVQSEAATPTKTKPEPKARKTKP